MLSAYSASVSRAIFRASRCAALSIFASLRACRACLRAALAARACSLSTARLLPTSETIDPAAASALLAAEVELRVLLMLVADATLADLLRLLPVAAVAVTTASGAVSGKAAPTTTARKEE